MANFLKSLFIKGVEVDTASATSGQVLQFNGTKFLPASAAGGASISDTPPSSPSVGQIWYESDTGKTFVYYDSFWVETTSTGATGPAGKILQVVTATTTTTVAESAGTWTNSGLSASITPSSASSKIMVTTSQSMYNYAAGGGFASMNVRLVRGSTTLQTFVDVGFLRAYVSPAGVDNVHQFSINYVDSPSTTSSITYRTDIARAYGNSVYAQVNSNPGSITLMEISG